MVKELIKLPGLSKDSHWQVWGLANWRKNSKIEQVPTVPSTLIESTNLGTRRPSTSKVSIIEFC